MLEINELRKILPQDYPFLMIDKVVAYEKDKSLTAVKLITGNEWVFEGRDTVCDYFPETLIVEAAAQAALAFYCLNTSQKGNIFLGTVKAEFHEQVNVGDQIQCSVLGGRVLKQGGYMDVGVTKENLSIADVQVFYGLKSS